MACIECQQNNPCAPEPCVQETCACPVFLEDICITTTEDMPYTGITKGKTLNEWILALDEYLQNKFTSIENFFKLKNIGLGAKVYKGISILGEKEIRSLTSEDNSVTIIENTNSIDFSVLEVTQNNFVRQLQIDNTLLPSNYTKQDICTYILSLPANQRTILETDSKWNILIGYVGDFPFYYFDGYEIIDKGKGVITTLTEDNLQFNYGGIDQVVREGNTIYNNDISITQPNFTSHYSAGGLSATNTSLGDSIRIGTTQIVQQLGNKFLGINPDSITFGKLISNNQYTIHIPNADAVSTAGMNVYFPEGKGAGNYTLAFLSDIPIIDGSETKITAGTNVTVTGIGTIPTPFVINNTAPDQVVSLTQGGATTITGTYPTFTITSTDTNTTYSAGIGLSLVGTTFSVDSLQKVITYPTDFTGTNYTVVDADNNYTIIVDNAATAVTITVPSGLTSKIGVGFIQKGTADITFVASGTTINNPIGLKSKGQYYQTFIEQEITTNVIYLLGNTKI